MPRPPLTTTRMASSLVVMACMLMGCSQKGESLLDSAKLYLGKNDNRAAIIQIKNVLQASPNLPEARFLLGSALLKTGDAAGAETELRKSMELHHPMDAVVPQLAKAMLAQDHAKAVTDEFSDLQLVRPAAQADLQNSLAAAYALQGQDDKSEAALQAALKADPEFGPALLERARKMLGQRDIEAAHALITTVIAKTPQDHAAWKLKGDAYWIAQGKAAEAVDAYRKALAIKPDFLAGHGALVMALLQQANPDSAATQLEELKKLAPNHPQTQYLSALLAYQKKDFKAANDQVLAVLKISPDHIAALQLAGATELQLHHLRQAQAYLSKALAMQATLPTARKLLIVTYLRSNQSTQAMEALLPALDQTQADSELASLAGEVYLRHGNFPKAQEYFTLASAQDPQSGKKRTSVALVHLLRGSTESAFGELREISESDTGTTADLALISTHMHRKEYAKALGAIDTLEKKQPTKALPSYLRAQVLYIQHQTKEARVQLERAAVLEPSFFPAVAALAALDLADKKPVEARKRFDALLLKEPKNGQALLALADLAVKTGAPNEEVARLLGNAVAANPTDVNTRLVLVNFYLRSKDSKGALSAAENAAAALPKEPLVLDALGRTQQASGDLHQALASYRKMADATPQSHLPHWRLAETHMAMKDKEAAINSLRKSLNLKPDFLEGQRALIALYVNDKKYPDALAIARAVQNKRPNEDVGYVLEGDIHGSNNQWGTATQALRTGLDHVRSTTLAMRLHAALQAANKANEADRFALNWQKDHPKDAAFIFFLGDQALARNDYKSAEKHYSFVVTQQPNNPIALNNLAWVSAKLKKDAAIGFAEKAVALAPDQPMFLDTLATLRAEKGDHVGAMDLQTRALALQPQNSLLKFNLAKIQLRAGRKDLAKETLNDLASLGPAFRGHDEVSALQKELAGMPTVSTR